MRNFFYLPFVFFLCSCASIGGLDGDWPFRRSLNSTTHGYSQVLDVSMGKVDVFEVRFGDCDYQPDWSDCENDRERSELSSLTLDKNEESWSYEWYIYIPHDFPDLAPSKTTLGQFHQRKSRPSFMFNYRDKGYWVDKNIDDGQRVKLFGEDRIGKWNFIRVDAHWSDSNGTFSVSVNNKIIHVFEGRNYTGDGVFFKYGIYRSFLSRYKSYHSSDKVPTQAVFYAGVRKCHGYLTKGNCYRSVLK